jgi:hypothetical protein
MEKDAGESWLTRGHLPDHLAGYVSVHDLGLIEHLVVGDFEVNFGQGLVQWQGMAFRKGANTMEVMRSGPVFRAHRGADENRFHRGLAVGLHRRSWNGYFYLGLDRLDAHHDVDSNGLMFYTSFQTSGLHRTASEIRDRHSLPDFAYGGRIAFSTHGLWLGLNLSGHRLGGSFRGSGDPYTLYAFSGHRALNLSIDHHLRAGPIHLYGEWALDREGHTALTEGLLCSPGPGIDLVVQARAFSVAYRSLWESPFADGSRANNEIGVYAGLEWRPSGQWRVNAYVDRYRFPWLRFGVDEPSDGRDALVRVGWKPEKSMEVYGQFSWESRPQDLPGTDPFLLHSGRVNRFRARLHADYAANRFLALRFRMEYCGLQGLGNGRGFMGFVDLAWKNYSQLTKIMCRVLFVDTDGYGSRIYGYEGQGFGVYAIPAHFGQGAQWSVQAVRRLSRHVEGCLSLRQSNIYSNDFQGSGYDLVAGHRKTEWNLILRSSF